MPGTIIENLSGRKLGAIIVVLFLAELACFLIGGMVSPPPAGTLQSSTRICVDPEPGNKTVTRFVPMCDSSPPEDDYKHLRAEDLVFVMQMPPGIAEVRDFSRWQQNLVGVIDMHFKEEPRADTTIELILDARLAYKNKGDSDWTYLSHSVEKRLMDCHGEGDDKGGPSGCTIVPLFELGSLHHDFYLLNLRLPSEDKQGRNHIGPIQDITLHLIHMNGGFTMIWLSLKALFFPMIVGLMMWFWHRVHILERTPALLEYMLIYLGGSLAFLDMPLEFLTLFFDMPYMLLLSDIRQGIFYAMLFSFWLVFAGEHMLIQDNGEKNTLRLYWKHLSAIVIGCASLLVFDLCERGVQLINPFYTIWVTPVGTNLALSFIILACISACIYFVFLCYMVWNVFKNISIKRTSLPNMSSARRLHYEGIIYRFNFLMLATLVCAALTIASFILSQFNEGHHNWDDNADQLELSAALFTGVYGMWNVYIMALLILYAPSHKKWPSEPICGENAEEVEFNRLPADTSANEISSLTSFASKAATD